MNHTVCSSDQKADVAEMVALVCACAKVGGGAFVLKNKVTYHNMNLINRMDHLWTETAGFLFFSGIG